MKLSRKDRALLHKLMEEAGEVIKAAADVLQDKGTLLALADEIADARAVSDIAVRQFKLARPVRYAHKLNKYSRRYDG